MKTDQHLYGMDKSEFLCTTNLTAFDRIRKQVIKRLNAHHDELQKLRPLDIKQQQGDIQTAIKFWESL